ncbi:Methylated-DNA--protein-cysteine methyltransferase [Rhodopirellula islandica]|uniref:methylated-DNA--[protein]-cysteine S-methyltransferase n=1 Tax=Rhodopirellula islandica TaxID=595434 RepID=A0A0J1B9D1_RHOIS|nr:methylated-DNA--[protein]-cysteine S-methyltransferase [Rhodopirellula islandica]KLU03076.1 Methylated-DNA--protein-cysteine methyltransferase [Rhodopirellula islandica]
MTHSSAQQRASDSHLIFATGACSLGQVLIAGSNIADVGVRVSFLSLGDNRASMLAELATAHPKQKPVETDAAFQAELAAVIRFIEQPAEPLRLPMELHGTEFQKQVWTALAQTKPGETITYRELADRIGSPGSSRAVGSACGQNQIALAIPCHRAVRSDGKDSGFRWGLSRKRELLRRERLASIGTTASTTHQLDLAGFDVLPTEQSSATNTTKALP